MDFLVFQLQAPLSSWGDVAVGEFRGSYEYPAESALVGLLGAALGLRREDESGHVALMRGYRFAVGVQSAGRLLRDYHTAQVPGRVALKSRPHRTRRDELNMPKDELNPIRSTRDYRQDAACLVAVQALDDSPHPLDALAEALRRPRFVLYLGRKSCPPAVPLYPQLIGADSVRDAFENYRSALGARIEAHTNKRGLPVLEPMAEVVKLIWAEGVESGVAPDITTVRKDRLIRRQGWQFGDRAEHVALLTKGS